MVIYRHFLHPWLEKHEKVIDDALLDAQARAVVASADFGKKSFNMLIRSLNSSPSLPKSDSSDVDENITIVENTASTSVKTTAQSNSSSRKQSNSKHERYHTAHANLSRTQTSSKSLINPADVIDKLMNDMKGKDYLT